MFAAIHYPSKTAILGYSVNPHHRMIQVKHMTGKLYKLVAVIPIDNTRAKTLHRKIERLLSDYQIGIGSSMNGFELRSMKLQEMIYIMNGSVLPQYRVKRDRQIMYDKQLWLCDNCNTPIEHHQEFYDVYDYIDKRGSRYCSYQCKQALTTIVVDCVCYKKITLPWYEEYAYCGSIECREEVIRRKQKQDRAKRYRDTGQ